SDNHPGRVQRYAARLCRVLELDEAEVHGITIAALLHDVGKLAVPEHILSKTHPLTSSEVDAVRTHSQIGADIVAAVPFASPVASVILGHHERWDGTGYPHGLRAEQIPLGARILAVVDCFDSMMSARPYHGPRAVDEAIALIEREAGAALDPRLVALFVQML